MEPEYVITTTPFEAFQHQQQPISSSFSAPQHDELSAALLADDNDRADGKPQQSQHHAAAPQPEQYRDIWAALLWILVQLVTILCVVWRGTTTTSATRLLRTGVGSGIVVGVLVSAVTLTTLLRLAPRFVELSLMMAVGGLGLGTVWMVWQQWQWGGGGVVVVVVLGSLATCVAYMYARAVWRRIPLAAAYVHVAAAAVQAAAPAVWVVTYSSVAVVALYSRVWGWECYRMSNSDSSSLLLLLVVVAYVWTVTVVRNIVHVTVAGAVGTFVWCPPAEPSAQWRIVWDALVRACTFSLGSICLGSLLTATVTVAYEGIRFLRRTLVRGPQQRHVESWLFCVLECILSFLHRLMEYFHTYAYVYVALYGYDYLTAGQKVAQLFQERGMTVLVNDDLVQRALLLVGALIGCITGAVGYMWASSTSDNSLTGTASWLAFGVPFGMGVAVASIVLRVVSSAVDTIVVAYTEDPVTLEQNHPAYAARIQAAYRQIYPDATMVQQQQPAMI